MKTSILSLTLAAVLAGCGRAPAPPPEPLRFETQKFEKTQPGFVFRVEWPSVVNGGDLLRKSLNGRIKQKLQPEDAPPGFAAEADALFAGWVKRKQEFTKSRCEYRIERKASILRHDTRVLSIQFDDVTDRCGVRPSASRGFFNVRASAGTEIQLEDIVQPDMMAELAARVEKRFREARKDAAFKLNRNFGITSTGLVFCFNDDELGTRSMGPIELALSWTDLEGVLNAEGRTFP